MGQTMRNEANILRYGSPHDLPEERALRAGPLSVTYVGGDLRYVRLGQREIVRRIYMAVRDRNWHTIPAMLTDEVIEQADDRFEIRYRALHQEGPVCFRWQAHIVGTAAGEITFRMQGEACSTFWRNRIGICVLHPAEECAGAPCRVTHTDGRVTVSAFPRDIAPHQPFQQMRAIAHEVQPGLWAELQLVGDIFEMEDQRNWTDASFKTYSTPLALPFPVRIEAGTPVEQAVRLSLQGALPPRREAQPAAAVRLTLGDVVRQPRPPLGLGVASHGEALNEVEMRRLRDLHLDHLRVDLAGDAEAALLLAATQATSLGAGLEIGLPLVRWERPDLERLGRLLNRLNAPIVRWLLLTDGLGADVGDAIRATRAALEPLTPRAAWAVGVNAYFTELNRNRPPMEHADMACYSLNPQVHAFDNLSLVETLPAQAVTVESACQFLAGRPVAVSPVTLRPRYNPNATDDGASAAPGALPDSVDPRQVSLLGAGWTLVSLKYLMGHPAVHSLTYYETTGWRGVMERPQGSPLETFPSRPGQLFPLYHVFRWVGACRAARVRRVCSSAPRQVDALALQGDSRLQIGVANLTNVRQRVELAGVDVPLRRVILDKDSVEEATQSAEGPLAWRESAPMEATVGLELGPYAVAWFTGEAPS
jgi:D-apionolactonase